MKLSIRNLMPDSFYDPDYYADTQTLTTSHINYTSKKRKRVSLCICVTKDGENNTEEALGRTVYDETVGVKKWEGPKGSNTLCVSTVR